MRNKKDNLNTDDAGKENENKAEIVGKNVGENYEKQNVGMFKKPLSEGWERECIVREGKISNVYYLSPTTADGRRRRFKDKECLGRFLRTMKSCLLESNFSFDRKLLRLDGELEREAKAASSFTYQTPAIFSYWKESQDEYQRSFPRRRKGTCSLCEDYGEETVTVLRERFLTHMINFHLPDERHRISSTYWPLEILAFADDM